MVNKIVLSHVLLSPPTPKNVFMSPFQLLEVRMQRDLNDIGSPDPGGEQTATLPTSAASCSPQETEPPNQLPTGNNSSEGPRDNLPCLQYSLFLLLLKNLSIKLCTLLE